MQVSVKVNMTGSWSVVLGSNPGLALFCKSDKPLRGYRLWKPFLSIFQIFFKTSIILKPRYVKDIEAITGGER